MKRLLPLFVAMTLLAACTGLPDNVSPVSQFEQQRYLGKWYEIARFDNRFERGLEQVTATYSVQAAGSLLVLNQGVNESGERKQATGQAKFVGQSDIGHLKVSFFGPFYASYVIFNLDPQYQTAYVAGNNHNYLWLLARTPEVSETVKADFVMQAKQRGFNLENLVWVQQ